MTNQELVEALNTASKTVDNNMVLCILLEFAANRIQELDDRCDELAADKGTYFRLYEALCVKMQSDKESKL
jgi:hypothetical protein